METQPNFQENHDNNEIQNPEIQDSNKDLGQAQEMGEIALDSLKNEIIPADDSNDETNPTGVGALANKNNYSVAEATISSEEITAFSVGMNAIEKRFGEESAAHISNELLKIDSIRNGTLDALEQMGELKPELRSMARGLSTRGINAYNLTPDEVGRVYNYATNATPEIERAKVDRIFDAFHRHINSPSGRRDGLEPAFYNLEEAERNVLISKDNIYHVAVRDTDTPEMQIFKEALNKKNIDILAYKPRFLSDYSNDVRVIQGDSITFGKLKKLATIFDMDITMSIKDKPNAVNPIGEELTAKINE